MQSPVHCTKRERASFVLSDAEVLTLARWGCAIEAHYGRPMDVEWAKDGETGQLFVVQARPETVQSRRKAAALQTYTLLRKGRRLLTGVSIGGAIAAGRVRKLRDASAGRAFEDGAILVTEMTDPDWVPIMKRAASPRDMPALRPSCLPSTVTRRTSPDGVQPTIVRGWRPA